MNNNVLKFHVWLVFTLTLSFLIHNFIVDSSHLLLLYSFKFFYYGNFCLLVGFYFKKQTKRKLGYIFLIGTLIKFLVFFLNNITSF